MQKWKLIVVVSTLMTMPAQLWAWGKEGHAVVGKIADKNLSKTARRAIEDILDGDQFKSLADEKLPNWADDIKNSSRYEKLFPDNKLYHYIDLNVEGDEPTLKSLEDQSKFKLKGKNNALSALKYFQDALKTSTDRDERRYALFFIAHLIGDIHQPLHCADRDDRGGNLCFVQLPNEERVTNLHAIWDLDLVKSAMNKLNTDDYAGRLDRKLSDEDRKKYQAGTLDEWILETHKTARANVTKFQDKLIKGDRDHPCQLKQAYVNESAEIVERQLTKGGMRLAQFLNDTLK